MFNKKILNYTVSAILILVGIYFIINPVNVIKNIFLYLGLLLLLVGIIQFIIGLFLKDESKKDLMYSGGIFAFVSLIILLIGKVIFSFIVGLVGLYFIISSIIKIVLTYKYEKKFNDKKALLINILQIILGIVILLMPIIIKIVSGVIIGIILIIVGISIIITNYETKRVYKVKIK